MFGAANGLVTNSSLIAGVGGGGAATHTIVLTGVAGLVAGAFSMATGEYISITSQNEAIHAEVTTEEAAQQLDPQGEIAELARHALCSRPGSGPSSGSVGAGFASGLAAVVMAAPITRADEGETVLT